MAQRSPLFPIFLIVLVDVLGFTIVIPLLAFYSEHFGATPLVATSIVSVYALCSLISTPILGRLSDRFGRRPMLLVSQAGTFLGFLVLGWSSALWMVFVGRILDGITAGNLSIAQAYITDHSKPENRAKAYGVIGVAFGVGFTVGPWIGGVLGKYDLHFHLLPTDSIAAHSVSSPLPFLVAAGLSALSMICTFFLLPRELPPQSDAPPDVPAMSVVKDGPRAGSPPAGRRPGAFDIKTYAEYFRRPNLAALYVQFFLFAFSFACFTSGFALFAERRFSHDGHPWTASEVGWLFAYTGVCGIILQGGLIGRLVKRFGEVPLVIIGFIAASISYVVLGVAGSVLAIGLAATVSSFGNGVLRPVITSRISQAVGRHEVGTALGISGSLQSLALMIAPVTGGFLIGHDQLFAWTMVPATIAGLGLLVARSKRGSAKLIAPTITPPPAT